MGDRIIVLPITLTPWSRIASQIGGVGGLQSDDAIRYENTFFSLEVVGNRA